MKVINTDFCVMESLRQANPEEFTRGDVLVKFLNSVFLWQTVEDQEAQLKDTLLESKNRAVFTFLCTGVQQTGWHLVGFQKVPCVAFSM